MTQLARLQPIRLSFWYRWCCYAVWLIISITGVWWWWDQQIQMNDPELRAVWLIKAHGIMAAACLIILGSLLPTHMQSAWLRQRNRLTGAIALFMMALLVISGVGLYYANMELREWMHTVHLWVGGIAVLAMPLHVVIGRLLRRKQSLLAKATRGVNRSVNDVIS